MKEMNELEMPNAAFSKEFQTTLDFIKNDLAKELPTLVIDLDYFILGVFTEKQSDLYRRLDSCMMSYAMNNIYDTWREVVTSKSLTAVKGNREIKMDTKFMELCNRAVDEAKNCDSDEVTTEHLFLAVLSDENNNSVKKVFNKLGITYGIFKNKVTSGEAPLSDWNEPNLPDSFTSPDGVQFVKYEFNSESEAKKFLDNIVKGKLKPGGAFDPFTKQEKSGRTFITKYCNDLNKLAEEGKMDPIIGRQKELDEVIRILGRRRKNNVIIVGNEGVGKTALAESLAYKIVKGEVPEFLLKKRIISLDMTAVIAGTTLRGMFEERVKGILDEIKNDPRYILLMDNIASMLGDKGSKGDYDMSAMLARALENGELQAIGTSDFSHYRQVFDKDPSIARRFQKIIIDAPSIEDSIDIINGLRPSYEKHHKVKFDDDATKACVMMASRYLTDRNLPDSAIDLLDEAGAYIGTIREPDLLKDLRKEIADKEAVAEDLKRKKKYEEHDELGKELINLRQKYNDYHKAYEKSRTDNPPVVTKDDILNMVSIKTNIPVNNLSSDDKAKLVHMNDRIKENVVGQDEAIDTICKALKRNRVGLHKNGCMYSAMCIGKTGTGKTLIAKKLAKELFGDESALARFDMSEYSDKVSVNKLIGSNPGYVGYEEGGQLTETIKNKKHCVLLIDEIEKADPEVYNIFLQVLDEGFLTDNSGMKVDFKNVIIIFTSNIGARAANDFGRGIGFDENEDSNTKRILTKELKKKFPPEFLNRVDDVIYFNSLTEDDLKKIIKIEIGKLEEKMAPLGYSLEYDETVVDHIYKIIKEDKDYGARPIIRAIQDTIEDKITDALLENDYEKGHNFKVTCDEQLNEVVVA